MGVILRAVRRTRATRTAAAAAKGGTARGQANGSAARQQQELHKRAVGEELEQQLRRALTGQLPMAPQPLSPDGAPRGITAQGKYSLAFSVAARLLPTLHLPLPWAEAGRTPQIHAAASLIAADAEARSALGCSSVAGRCVVEGAVGGSHERRHYTQHVKFTGALLQRLAGLGAAGCRLEAAAWRLGPGGELMLEVTVIGPAAQDPGRSAGVANAGPRTPSAALAPGRGSEKAARQPRGSEGAGPAAPAGGAEGGGARGARDQASGAAAAAAAAGSPVAEGGAARGGGGGGGPAGGADFSPVRDAPKVSTMAEVRRGSSLLTDSCARVGPQEPAAVAKWRFAATRGGVCQLREVPASANDPLQQGRFEP
jgi:hypothetical protein